MGLVGDSRELGLLDLVQVKGLARSTCRILVNGRHGPGALFLEKGVAVHASYAGLSGEAAAYAVLAEELVGFRVTSDVALPPPNMRLDHQRLLLQAALHADEARRRRPAPPPPPPPARAPRRIAPLLAASAAVGAVAVLVVGGTVSFHRSEASATVAAPPPPAEAPRPQAPALEASRLVGPRDALPVLAAGLPPRSPPGSALRPTVVCRLLVDERGRVARAEVYQARPDLAAFEEAALAAVRRFAFQPAQHEGAPVAVWINWPVDFL